MSLVKLVEQCLVRKTVFQLKLMTDTRISVQKRLLLGSLKEIYQQFKDQFPVEKIGFSRFAELFPKHCVLAGASGTHAVCVCTIHQNT